MGRDRRRVSFKLLANSLSKSSCHGTLGKKNRRKLSTTFNWFFSKSSFFWPPLYNGPLWPSNGRYCGSHSPNGRARGPSDIHLNFVEIIGNLFEIRMSLARNQGVTSTIHTNYLCFRPKSNEICGCHPPRIRGGYFDDAGNFWPTPTPKSSSSYQGGLYQGRGACIHLPWGREGVRLTSSLPSLGSGGRAAG